MKIDSRLTASTDGLKGQQHLAQGNTLGNRNRQICNAPWQGQKHKHIDMAFALAGRVFPSPYKTQGDALGYELIDPTGRSKYTCGS